MPPSVAPHRDARMNEVRWNVGWLVEHSQWGWFVYYFSSPTHIEGTGGRVDHLQDAYAMIYRYLEIETLKNAVSKGKKRPALPAWAPRRQPHIER